VFTAQLTDNQILGRRLALLNHHNFPDYAIDMVEALDIDGMSSEESEGEVGVEPRSFTIKKLPWRSPDLTEWLHRVDGLPTRNAQNAVLTKRAFHRQRRRGDIISANREPVARLSVNLYHPNWMKQQDIRAKARIGALEDGFELPKIDEFTPRNRKD
jgi:hypothetical protein